MFGTVFRFFNRQVLQSPSGDGAGIHHSWWEDLYAFTMGSALIVLGMLLLKSSQLVTGGVAGLALLASYWTKLPVGTLFMLINLPFFIFAYIGMGLRFTLKTLFASVLIMGIGSYAPQVLNIQASHPFFASTLGGTLLGIGILFLARHGAGAGGTGVLCLYLQRRKGINAGKTQMLIDALVLTASLFTLGTRGIGYSILSAAAMSAVMISFHNPARYLGR